jgi:hypothetical protein
VLKSILQPMALKKIFGLPALEASLEQTEASLEQTGASLEQTEATQPTETESTLRMAIPRLLSNLGDYSIDVYRGRLFDC